MPDIDTVRGWQGATLVGSDGDKIGSIDSIHLDDQTGEPEWALVNTGFFGTKSSFVPLAQASASGDQVQVPYDKQLVKDAPPGSIPTSTWPRPNSSSCGATTASTTRPPTPTPTGMASMTTCRTPRWVGTLPGRPPMTP